MSTRGNRLPSITQQGLDGSFITNIALTAGAIAGMIYVINLSFEKEHHVSKRGKIANNIGQTHVNQQIGMMNAIAHRQKKLVAGGKYDYSKKSSRDINSILYRS